MDSIVENANVTSKAEQGPLAQLEARKKATRAHNASTLRAVTKKPRHLLHDLIPFTRIAQLRLFFVRQGPERSRAK